MALFDPLTVLFGFLVFTRVGGVLTAAPFFEQNFIPIRVKLLFAIVVSFGMVGFVPIPEGLEPQKPVALAYYTLIELLTGVVIGFAARFIFFAIRFAGEFIGFQMALSISQVISPADGQSSNPISNFLIMTFTLVFLLLDGHHLVFQGLAYSFEVIPLAGGRLHNPGPMMLTWTGQLFVTALQLAAPFMITIFLIDLTLGIFARVAPQAEIFSTSLSIKLIVGVILTYFYIQNFFPIIPDMINKMTKDILDMIEALTP